MKIVSDDLWLCVDCLMFAVNGDLTSIDYYYNGDAARVRAKEVEEGVAALGPHLVPYFGVNAEEGTKEFSWRHCDACKTGLGGERHRFAVLGEEDPCPST